MPDTSTPSGRILASANAEKQTKDSLGRAITYRRLLALDKARLFKAIGAQNAPNVPYVGLALVSASATSVDGVPMPFPSSDALIEAAIARLGDEGLEAVAASLVADEVMKDMPGESNTSATSTAADANPGEGTAKGA